MTSVDWRRRLAIIALAAACVFVAAELGARGLDGRLREPLVWHTYEAQKKVGQIDALAESGGADIVFLGHSMIHSAVEPDVFLARAATGQSAYNAALSSAIGRQTELWATEVVLPRLHPEFLVIGVSSFDFTDAGLSRTAFFDALSDSLAVKILTGSANAIDRVDNWLVDHSALWAHRFQLRQPQLVLDALRGDDPEIEREVAGVEADGHSNSLADLKFEDRPPGANLDVSAWKPGRQDRDAFARLIEAARQAGAQVVLVDLPVTDEYVARHPRGQADYDEYLAHLRTFATEVGVPLLEFNTIRDHPLFADEIHLNRTGSEQFSAMLADALRPMLQAP